MSQLIGNYQTVLARWLAQYWPQRSDIEVDPNAVQPVGSGFSATTLILPVRYEQAGERIEDKVVLRLEPPEEPTYPPQNRALTVEIELQYRVMSVLLSHSRIPLAPLIGYEADASVLGRPFYVMDYIGGEVPVENPIYTSEGFFVEAAPQQRRSMTKNGLTTLATLHEMDWQQAGLDWLIEGDPGAERQLKLWQQWSGKALAGRVHPLLENTYQWLWANLPAHGPLVFCWGDARPGNIIWQDFEVACVCDFESAAIAPAEMDVGWWLMFDRYAHEAQGVARLEGELTRGEQLAFYAQISGRTLQDLTWFEIFAGVRYATLVVLVMNRWVARGELPADHNIWLENPVADMLQAMFNELTKN